MSSGHEKFLDYADLGVRANHYFLYRKLIFKKSLIINFIYIFFFQKETVDDVETLFKRHEDFENTLLVQDEKLKDLDEMADKRIAEGHPDKDQ